MATKHVIQSTKVEITVAIILIVAGCFLVWDCYDNRGRQLPVFARWFSFW